MLHTLIHILAQCVYAVCVFVRVRVCVRARPFVCVDVCVCVYLQQDVCVCVYLQHTCIDGLALTLSCSPLCRPVLQE